MNFICTCCQEKDADSYAEHAECLSQFRAWQEDIYEDSERHWECWPQPGFLTVKESIWTKTVSQSVKQENLLDLTDLRFWISHHRAKHFHWQKRYYNCSLCWWSSHLFKKQIWHWMSQKTNQKCTYYEKYEESFKDFKHSYD